MDLLFFFLKKETWHAIYRNLRSFAAVGPNVQAVPETERDVYYLYGFTVHFHISISFYQHMHIYCD